MTSLVFMASVLFTIPRTHTLALLGTLLVGPILSVHMAAISGMAPWMIWYGKAWMRGWAIAATFMYVLLFLQQFVVSRRPTWDHHLVPSFAGLPELISLA